MRHQQTLSPKDWQLLSEYMDGQLSARDQARLEQRLQERDDLRAALDELRRTRAVLRSVKLKRVPRNFTLTPAMLPQSRPNPFARLVLALNFTSAVSTLAMVIVLVVGLFPGLSAATGIGAAPESPANATAQDAQQYAASSEAPMIIEWVPAFGMGGGGASEPMMTMQDQGSAEKAPPGAGAVEPPAAAMPAPLEEPLPQATPAPDMTMRAAPSEPAAGAAEAPTSESLAAPESVSQAPLEGSGPILGVRPAGEAEANNRASLKALTDENRAARPTPFPWVVPALLALIALGSLLTVSILRRNYNA